MVIRTTVRAATAAVISGLLAACGGSGAPAGSAAPEDSPAAGSAAPLAAAPTLTAAAIIGAPDIEIDNYTLVSSTRISRTVFEYTYAAHISNWGATDATINATVASTVASTTVMDGAVGFGDVAEGATEVSIDDTFTIRQDRSQPFNGDALVWTVQVTPLAPTTVELIDQALAAGIIDAETALLYEVYGVFHDQRLPLAYQGRDDGNFEAAALREAAQTFDTLSPVTQQLLAPFLAFPDFDSIAFGVAPFANIAAVPRIAAASAAAVTETASVRPQFALDPTTLTGIVVVPNQIYIAWNKNEGIVTDVHAQWASRASAEITSTIWPRLTALFGVPASGTKIAILLDSINYGTSHENTADCIKIDITLTKLDYSVLTHELTHAIVDQIYPANCNRSGGLWMHETTAKWAEHYVYPSEDREHRSAPSFLDKPDLSLDFRNRAHEYGAYLWFLYLTEGASYANPSRAQFVPMTWSAWNTQASGNSLEAIDSGSRAAGGGGLKDDWPKFALYNWNRVQDGGLFDLGPPPTIKISGDPYVYYGKWDGVFHKARELYGVQERKLQTTNGVGGLIDPIEHDLPPLSTRYAHFIFKPDSRIHQIIFTNDYANAEPRASVQAITKIKGQWNTADDWSDTKRKFFCMDKQDEKLEELVLVISNRDHLNRTNLGGPQTNQTSPVKLSYGSLPCYDWVGFVNYDDNDADTGIHTTSNATGVRFKIDGARSDLIINYYTATAGVVNWHISDTPSGCSPVEVDGSYAAMGEMMVVAGGLPFYTARDTGPGDGKLVRANCTGGPTDLFYSAPDWVDIGFTPFTIGATDLAGNVGPWSWLFFQDVP